MNQTNQSSGDDDIPFENDSLSNRIVTVLLTVITSGLVGGGLGFVVSQNHLGVGIGMVIAAVLNLIGLYKTAASKLVTAINWAACCGVIVYKVVSLQDVAVSWRLVCGLIGFLVAGFMSWFGTSKTSYQQRIDYDAIQVFKGGSSVAGTEDHSSVVSTLADKTSGIENDESSKQENNSARASASSLIEGAPQSGSPELERGAFYSPSQQSSSLKQPLPQSNWMWTGVGCTVPLLLGLALVGGIYHWRAMNAQHAADFTRAPGCGNTGYIDASLAPCTYSQATVKGMREDYPSYSQGRNPRKITVFDLQTPDGIPLEVGMSYNYSYGSFNNHYTYDPDHRQISVHPGDMVTIRHWSGVITDLKVDNAWLLAHTNPGNYGEFDFVFDGILPLLATFAVYTLLLNLARRLWKASPAPQMITRFRSRFQRRM